MKSAGATVSGPSPASAVTVFAWLWAAAVISHMASYSEPLQAVTVALFAAALLVLFRPSTTHAFFVLLVVHLIYVYHRLPHVPNHSILAATIDLTILTAAIFHLAKGRTWRIEPDEFYRSFAAVVRIEILVLYFFVVFHKLNNGFFHTEESCSAFMYLRLAREYPFLPTAEWARAASIYSTILIEAAIPILLVVRRLRLAGLALAFVFHFALAMDPGDVVFNFSAALIALYFLFLPDDFSAALSSTLAPLQRAWRDPAHRLRWVVSRAFVYVCLPALFASLIFREAIATGLTYEASRVVWVVYSAFIAAVFLATVLKHRLTLPSARALLAVRSPALLIFPALMVANGVLPYLGGKTETSFAMYSNLRTEGGYSNHWLMPESLQVWDYQRDLVTIHRTSVRRIQRLANRHFQWTYFEFKWLMRDFPDASVTFERNGVVKTVKKVKDDPELMHPGSAMMRKMLKFRPVPADASTTACIH